MILVASSAGSSVQWRTIRVDTLGEGEKIVARMLATKIRKGYIQKDK
jgi:hypothetical protein